MLIYPVKSRRKPVKKGKIEKEKSESGEIATTGKTDSKEKESDEKAYKKESQKGCI